jgi:hypothetical protein
MILDPPTALEALHPVLNNLQHLELGACMADTSNVPLFLGNAYHPARLKTSPLPGFVLGHASNLTSLQLSGLFDDSSLQHLGHCSHLQQLHLDFGRCAQASTAVLAPLGQLPHLTKLLLQCPEDPYTMTEARRVHTIDITSSSTPSLQQLSRLRHLELHACDAFEPQLLGSMPHLTHLAVLQTPLQGGAAGATALLAVLPELQQLRKLLLTGSLHHNPPPPPPARQPAQAEDSGSEDEDSEDWDEEAIDDQQALLVAAQAAAAPAVPGVAAGAAAAEDQAAEEAPAPPPAPAAEAYAALTANPQLQHLDLADCTLHDQAAQHMFPAGLQCPQLSVLLLAGSKGGVRLSDPQVFHNVINCSHSLRELALCHELGDAAPLLELQQQAWLTELHVRPASSASAAQLASLTGLKVLWIEDSSVDDFGLFALTALRRLTELLVVSDSLSGDLKQRLQLPLCKGSETHYEYHRTTQVRGARQTRWCALI